MNKTNKAIFLDRDGVINKTIVRNGKPYAPLFLKDFKIIPGVKKTLKYLKKKNFLLIVVTNQPDVKSGKLKLTTLEKMNKILVKQLNIDEVFACKHDDLDKCKCRKPNNEFIEYAIKKYSIDRSKSYFIGDRKKDIDAGIKSNLTTIYISKRYKEPKPTNHHFSCKSLLETIIFIDKY